LLENADEQVALTQVTDDKGGEGTICREVGAEQDTAGLDAGNPQSALEQARRQVQHGARLTCKRQRGRQALERLGIARNREVTGPTPRCHPQLRQVHGQALLQLARAARGDQGGARRLATDVDQQAGTIGVRGSTGKRGCGCSRSTRPTDSRDEDEAPAHRPAGLA
jgi:hypothetical protein